MDKNAKIFVAGHNGLVGSALVKKLNDNGFHNLLFKNHSELDLTKQLKTSLFFEEEKPEYVFLAAAKVGGISANNSYRADFIYENLMIQNNVIHNSYLSGVKKLLFLGSTCIYPKNARQPIPEDELLAGPLEYTNEPYAVAKIAGIKMCESYNLQYGTNFISVMPTNLYGPNDNFDLEKSHVLPAMLRKILLGKLLENNHWDSIQSDLNRNPIKGVNGNSGKNKILETLKQFGIYPPKNGNPAQVEIWGTGKPKREFLWSGDMADACVFIMKNVNFSDVLPPGEIRNTHINIGSGEEISIKELAHKIKNMVGFKGELFFNTAKPDGTMRKVTDVSKLNKLGWKHSINLETGLEKLIKWYNH